MAKFHGNILSLSENIAKSFRGEVLFLTHTICLSFHHCATMFGAQSKSRLAIKRIHTQ